MTDNSIAPILLSARLRLRPHVRADYPACKALWQHPATIRFTGGVAQSDQDVWFRLLRYGGMWPLLGYGFWVFEDRVTAQYLGEGGLLDARRGIVGLQDIPEAGWAVTPEAGGRGIATEAMSTVLDWVDTQHTIDRTGCIIDAGNAPSLRVASKLGYQETGRPLFRGAPIVLLHRPRR
ncbi:MAG TPA: GNAT family N-acetyltransferase [Steroidobacteraceae bacterium]|nr:GNAT family N-acetyltransferase [Steroidobacteraceae bacterium]